MLIRLFKRSYLVQYLLLLILAVILWLPAMLNPQPITPPDQSFVSPAYLFLVNLLGHYLLTGIILSFLITFAGALLLNAILEKYDLVTKNTLVPAMVYLLVMSHQPEFLQFHPSLIPVFLMIVVLFNLFDNYTRQEAYSQIFNAGFLTGIASLFFFPTAGLFLFIWLTFFVYRLYKWREWIISLSAFLLVYFFLGIYYYLTDRLIVAFNDYVVYFSELPAWQFTIPSEIFIQIITGILILIILHALFLVVIHMQENVISVRKRFGSVFWFLAISLISVLFFPEDTAEGLRFFWAGSVILISTTFLKAVRLRWYEWITWVMAFLILINNYNTLLFKIYLFDA